MDLLLVWYGTSSFFQILPKSRITARLPYLCLLWGRLYRCCLVLETCSFSRMIYKWMTLTVDVRRVCIMSAFFFYFFLCLLLSNDLKCSTHLCIWSSRYLECILVRSLVVLYMYKALMFLLLLWLPSCEVSFLSLEFFLTFVLFARTIIGLWSCLFWCSFFAAVKGFLFLSPIFKSVSREIHSWCFSFTCSNHHMQMQWSGTSNLQLCC